VPASGWTNTVRIVAATIWGWPLFSGCRPRPVGVASAVSVS
jgi:hypothetical protein